MDASSHVASPVVARGGSFGAVSLVETGSSDASAAFVAHDGNVAVSFAASEISLKLPGPTDDQSPSYELSRERTPRPLPSTRTVSLRPLDAASVVPRGDGELPGRVHRLVGLEAAWQTDLRTFARLVYEDVWPGVDWVVEPRSHGIEYRFVIEPGAETETIRLAWHGADAIRLTDEGRGVEVSTDGGYLLRESGLRCFEGDGMAARDVPCRFEDDNGAYALRVDGRDRSKTLIVDPVIDWSSYLGTSGAEEPGAIAVDSFGNVYLTGTTGYYGFPTTDGFDTSFNGFAEAFVTKMDANGALVWSTYLGGNATDNGRDIAVDDAGHVYVVGRTASTDFPTPGGFEVTNGFNPGFPYTGFVTKIDAGGASLGWSSYFGGSSYEDVQAVVLDSSGDIYVVGETSSPDFPIIGGFQPTPGGDLDAFVAKVDGSGSGIIWSSYLGGTLLDGALDLAVDPNGNVYVVGSTGSANFPIVGAFDASLGSTYDAFVSKVAAGGASLVWSSYLGGGGYDSGWGTAVDAAGHVYVGGSTGSSNFPVLAGFDTSWNGGTYDGFVAKIDANGASLSWSTYLGGTGSDQLRDLTIDAAGNLYVVGRTASSNFPVPGGFDTTYGGGESDAFVTRMDPSGTSLTWSSFLGGSGKDDAWGVAVDLGGNIYVTGVTGSVDFPSAGGFDSTLDGEDVFVTKLAVPQANGVACETNADCISGICEDSMCCAVACGLCASCDAAGSTCSVMPIDDAGCGPIDCDSFDASCRDYMDITVARCATLGVCKTSDAATCMLYTDVIGSCDDGSGCTLNDTCNAGVCMSGASLACLPTNECHEAGTCNPLTGVCSEPTKPDGTSCSLGACQDGECVSSGQGGGGTGGVGGVGGEAGASASGAGGAGGHGGDVSSGSGRGGSGESAGGAGGSVEGGSGPLGTSVGGASSATPNPTSSVASDGCDCATPASHRSGPSSRISLLGAALLLAIKRRQAAKRRSASERSL